MRTDELDFDLPRELIATRPADPRDSARLLVVRREGHEHRRIRDLPEILRATDTIVFNATRVLPARFEGENLDTGGRVQGLWLRDVGAGDGRAWEVMLKARRHRPGRRIGLRDATGADTGIVLTIRERSDEEEGAWVVGVEGGEAGESTEALLGRAGMTPLPPYILSRRKEAGEEIADELDRAAYQTVFAHGNAAPAPGVGAAGSVAAPTAGLHFTPELLGTLADRGVRETEVTLHVGAGTFKSVETETVEEHPMHAEWCMMGEGALREVFHSPERRIVAVGSTATRTIESYAQVLERGEPAPKWLETRLLISPGYRWRRVGALLTNFHLPRSTLLAMVGAVVPGGIDRVRALYAEAVREEYRFFSYGDAMLILPDE